jgi:hypothetical protein
MLGSAVKCPACGVNFVTAAGPDAPPAPAAPPAPEPALEVAPRPPLPGDPDSLNSVRAGVRLQQIAHGLYAAGVALFLLTLFPTLAGAFGPGQPFGALAGLAALAGTLLVAGGAIVALVGGALCVLAPTARLARGLAIATLVLSALSFEQTLGSFSWYMFALEGYPSRMGGAVGFMPLLLLWVYETARLTVLALFWRAGLLLLHDRPGATLALRLACAVPTASAGMLAVVLLLALAAGPAGPGGTAGIGPALLLGGLAVLFLLLVWGVVVAGRLARRLRAVVPPG